MENEVVNISIDLDTSDMITELDKAYEAISELETLFQTVGASSVKVFAEIAKNIQRVEGSINSATIAMGSVTQLIRELYAIQMPQQGEQWVEIIAVAANLCTILQTIITLVSVLTIAKIKSKAEDIAICALLAADYVKAFAIMIADLVKSTAAWVANTAAKVASTTAEWAQIAATTAWQAICTTATAVTTAFGAALNFLTSPIGLVLIAVTALIAIIVLLINNWDAVKKAAETVWNGIVNVWNSVSNWFYQNVIQPVGKFFSGLWDGICNAATSAWDFLVGIWESIKEVFGKVWSWFQETILDPLVNGFKGMVNGVIGFINGLIGGIINGINWIIRAINKIQFTVPDWVPGLGGMTLGFNLKELTAPQIPYLAKGAVLPANRPFLAVVGDQRHGTNVEAPLATIQEAVGLVMNDHISAMMAGFRALLEEQQATRRTIEGIEIGDRVIGEAAQRYQRKMAVTYGTF